MSSCMCRFARRRSVVLVIAAAFMLAPIAAVGGCSQADQRNLEHAGEAAAEIAIGIIIVGVYIVVMVAGGGGEYAGSGSTSGGPSFMDKYFKQQKTPFY